MVGGEVGEVGEVGVVGVVGGQVVGGVGGVVGGGVEDHERSALEAAARCQVNPSPLPWSIDRRGIPRDADGGVISGPADAEMFVRAVNSHSALVEALKNTWCSNIDDNHAIGDDTPEAKSCPVCKNARAALLLAEGGGK